MNTRALAARALQPVLQKRQSLASSLPPQLAKATAQERGLLQELCYGVMRWHPRLHWLAQTLLNKPLKDKDQDIYALLLLGLYQLLYLRTPAHAAVNESVTACVQLDKRWARGLINGVLRTAQRELDALLARAEQQPEAHYAHPRWLLKELQRAWPDAWPAIVAQNNQHPPLTLRVNRRQHTRDAYLALLHEQGIEAEPCHYSADGITLAHARDVTQLPGFAAGAVSVQDEAAQLAVELMELKPQQRVLDACAAPGGKTCHLLEREPQLAEVCALDSDAERLQRVQDNLERLQLHAQLLHADAAALDHWWDGRPFDRILLDAPCSATGVIRRHPDIKWLRKRQDIQQLAALQQKLLQTLWQTLKPGGVMVYATCSIMPQENQDVIRQFLAHQADAEELCIPGPWGQAVRHGRQLFPQPQGHDGFYYARLRKLTP